MKSDAKRLAVVRAWLFAVTVVSGLIARNAAIAHDGKKHTDENPHEEGPVWYLLVRNPLTTILWECTGTFPLSSREEAAAWRCIGRFCREHRAPTEPEYPEY